jgi:hypothetical protein
MATLISLFSLLIAVAALAYGWKLQQELNTATRRLDRYNRALFDANDEVRRLRETLAETTTQLRVELKQTAGRLRFEPGMTVREAQMVHPQAQQILAGFHLGGCSSCAVEPEDTLAQVCADHEQDVTVLITNLNRLLENGNGQLVSTRQPVKIPNVAVEF